MEAELTEAEREQLRKFAALRQTALLIVMKWGWLLLLTFVVAALAFSALFVHHFAKSDHRYDATTQLLYTPRQVARIQNMSDKQLFSVLGRRSVKRRVGKTLALDQAERECLTIDLEIKQERHPSNLFTLTARAPTLAGAVKKVNGYAETLIEEYVDYRRRDLANWRESLDVRKNTLQKRVSELESEENTLKAQVGVIAPLETLTALNALLSDQRRNLSMLNVQRANEEAKRRKLEQQTGGIGSLVAANAAEIRKRGAAIAEIDAEIAALRERYTDLNPKVAGKLEERRAMMEAYTEFLKAHGITDVDLPMLDRIEAHASDLAETTLKLDVLSENIQALEHEIAENERRSGELTAVIPAFDRLRIKRSDVEQTLRDLDEQLENITYMEMSIRTDLQQIEKARNASDRDPLDPRNFVFAAVAAAICTFILALWLLAIELATGKVRDGREIALHEGITFIGSIPKPGVLPADKEKDALGVLALNFIHADLPKGIVLVARLDGASEPPQFYESLRWSLAMSGEQAFSLDIVPQSEFTPPADGETLITTVRKGSVGWFPVDNRYSLAPTEVQMLQADLATLRADHDHVFVHMTGGVRRGGSFFDQLLAVCDSVLLIVGANATPRSAFAYVRRHLAAAGKPAMAIATDVGARRIRHEMEDRK